jgi:GH24 family phage-related lysozyme (muramidase)
VRQSIKDAFFKFTERFEGLVPWMYLDVKGLVTVAVGNLIDPVGLALSLPFIRNSDGMPATQEEIMKEWNVMKSMTSLALLGHKEAKKHSTMRLTSGDIEKLVTRKLMQNETYLKQRFPKYEEWPADAQLAMHSMSWACGPGFDFVETVKIDGIFPKFAAHMYAGDFAKAVDECWIGPKYREVIIDKKKQLIVDPTTTPEERAPDPKNTGIHPRNLANVKLLRNAAAIITSRLDPEVLYYPAVLPTMPVEPPKQTEKSTELGPLEQPLKLPEQEKQPEPPEEIVVAPGPSRGSGPFGFIVWLLKLFFSSKKS